MAASDELRAAVIFLPLTLGAAIGSFTRAYDPALERTVGPHVTVVFPSRPAPPGALEDRLWAICRGLAPFVVDFDAVLEWPDGPDGAQRLVVLRVGEGRATLAALTAAAEVRDELATPHPEPYLPHLTLATGLPPSVAAMAAREAERFVGVAAFEVEALTVGSVDASGAFRADAVVPLAPLAGGAGGER